MLNFLLECLVSSDSSRAAAAQIGMTGGNLSMKYMYIVTNIGCTYSINMIQLIMIMYINVPLPFSIYKKIRFVKCDNQFAQT